MSRNRHPKRGARALLGAALLLAASCGEGVPEAPADPPAPVGAGAYAQNITIQRGLPGSIVEDTYIDTQRADRNFGGDAIMHYRYVNDRSLGDLASIALVRWDLAAVPKRSKITSATATFTVYYDGSNGGEVYRVTSAWKEYDATWNSVGRAYARPAVGNLGKTRFALKDSYTTTVNLTQLVQDWVDGKQANYGVAILFSNIGTSGTLLFSSNSGGGGDRPRLDITYEAGPCTGMADGTPCNDGDLCTRTDTCQKEACVGTNRVVCPGGTVCEAQSCNPQTGLCNGVTAPDGTQCDDGDACTQVDVCSAGRCTGTAPVVCTPSDACHLAGVCNAVTGRCTNPALPQGDLSTGLVSRFTFDEKSGPAFDSAGPGQGLLGNAATRTPSFDGSSAVTLSPSSTCDNTSFVDFGALPGVFGRGDFSILLWAKSSFTGSWLDNAELWSKGPFFNATYAGNGAFSYDANANYNERNRLSTRPNINDGRWHQLAFTRSKSTIGMWIDGSPAGTLQGTISDLANSDDFRIGYRSYYCAKPGTNAQTAALSVDDLRIYNRELTSCDLNTIAAPPCVSSTWSGTSAAVVPPTWTLNFRPAGAFSVALWANLGAGNQTLVQKGTAMANEWSISYGGGNVCLDAGKTKAASCAPVAVGDWHFYVMTYNAGTVTWYQDGARVGGGTATLPAAAQTSLNIGNAAGGGAGGLSGKLDRLTVFGVELSPKEVRDLGAGTVRPADVSRVAGDWLFSEGNGTIARDASGSNNNAALTGTGWSQTCAPRFTP